MQTIVTISHDEERKIIVSDLCDGLNGLNDSVEAGTASKRRENGFRRSRRHPRHIQHGTAGSATASSWIIHHAADGATYGRSRPCPVWPIGALPTSGWM